MFLRNNEGKLNLSKDVTMFGKGCCIQWGMGFLMQTQFTVCMFIFLHYYGRHIAWIDACGKSEFLKCDFSFKQRHAFCKGLLHWGIVFLMQNYFLVHVFCSPKKLFLHRSLASPIRVYIFIYYTVSWCHSYETCLSLKKIMTRHDYAYIHVVSSWFLRY